MPRGRPRAVDSVPTAARAQPPPPEFAPAAVRAVSGAGARMFEELNAAQEPQASLERQGLTFRKEASSATHLSGDDAHYYNTGGAAAAYWRGVDLGMPTTRGVSFL